METKFGGSESISILASSPREAFHPLAFLRFLGVFLFNSIIDGGGSSVPMKA